MLSFHNHLWFSWNKSSVHRLSISLCCCLTSLLSLLAAFCCPWSHIPCRRSCKSPLHCPQTGLHWSQRQWHHPSLVFTHASGSELWSPVQPSSVARCGSLLDLGLRSAQTSVSCEAIGSTATWENGPRIITKANDKDSTRKMLSNPRHITPRAHTFLGHFSC